MHTYSANGGARADEPLPLTLTPNPNPNPNSYPLTLTLTPTLTTPNQVPEQTSLVLAGCQQLVLVDGELLGDPMERAALQAPPPSDHPF